MPNGPILARRVYHCVDDVERIIPCADDHERVWRCDEKAPTLRVEPGLIGFNVGYWGVFSAVGLCGTTAIGNVEQLFPYGFDLVDCEPSARAYLFNPVFYRLKRYLGLPPTGNETPEENFNSGPWPYTGFVEIDQITNAATVVLILELEAAWQRPWVRCNPSPFDAINACCWCPPDPPSRQATSAEFWNQQGNLVYEQGQQESAERWEVGGTVLVEIRIPWGGPTDPEYVISVEELRQAVAGGADQVRFDWRPVPRAGAGTAFASGCFGFMASLAYNYSGPIPQQRKEVRTDIGFARWQYDFYATGRINISPGRCREVIVGDIGECEDVDCCRRNPEFPDECLANYFCADETIICKTAEDDRTCDNTPGCHQGVNESYEYRSLELQVSRL